MTRNKKWYSHLLSIPIVLLIDIAILIIALLIDDKIFNSPSGAGHPLPAFSTIVLIVLSIITCIVAISSIIKAISSLIGKDKAKEDINPKRPIKAFITPAIMAIISSIIVTLYGRKEINDFYNDPNHIGFAIPARTFALALLLFVATAIALIVAFIIFRKRRKQNKAE